MHILGLRGTDHEFVKTNSGKRKEVFHCQETNNTLVFLPYDKNCDRKSICNSIMDDRYFPLIEFLNTEKNLTIIWSQVEGTTSDYTIFKNTNLDTEELRSVKKIEKQLEGLIRETPNGQYKYNIVENGIISKMLFNLEGGQTI